MSRPVAASPSSSRPAAPLPSSTTPSSSSSSSTSPFFSSYYSRTAASSWTTPSSSSAVPAAAPAPPPTTTSHDLIGLLDQSFAGIPEQTPRIAALTQPSAPTATPPSTSAWQSSQPRIKHPLHSHELRETNVRGNWWCDSCHRNTGMTKRFRCAESCDYDLCERCIVVPPSGSSDASLSETAFTAAFVEGALACQQLGSVGDSGKKMRFASLPTTFGLHSSLLSACQPPLSRLYAWAAPTTTAAATMSSTSPSRCELSDPSLLCVRAGIDTFVAFVEHAARKDAQLLATTLAILDATGAQLAPLSLETAASASAGGQKGALLSSSLAKVAAFLEGVMSERQCSPLPFLLLLKLYLASYDVAGVLRVLHMLLTWTEQDYPAAQVAAVLRALRTAVDGDAAAVPDAAATSMSSGSPLEHAEQLTQLVVKKAGGKAVTGGAPTADLFRPLVAIFDLLVGDDAAAALCTSDGGPAQRILLQLLSLLDVFVAQLRGAAGAAGWTADVRAQLFGADELVQRLCGLLNRLIDGHPLPQVAALAQQVLANGFDLFYAHTAAEVVLALFADMQRGVIAARRRELLQLLVGHQSPRYLASIFDDPAVDTLVTLAVDALVDAFPAAAGDQAAPLELQLLVGLQGAALARPADKQQRLGHLVRSVLSGCCRTLAKLDASAAAAAAAVGPEQVRRSCLLLVPSLLTAVVDKNLLDGLLAAQAQALAADYPTVWQAVPLLRRVVERLPADDALLPLLRKIKYVLCFFYSELAIACFPAPRSDEPAAAVLGSPLFRRGLEQPDAGSNSNSSSADEFVRQFIELQPKSAGAQLWKSLTREQLTRSAHFISLSLRNDDVNRALRVIIAAVLKHTRILSLIVHEAQPGRPLDLSAMLFAEVRSVYNQVVKMKKWFVEQHRQAPADDAVVATADDDESLSMKELSYASLAEQVIDKANLLLAFQPCLDRPALSAEHKSSQKEISQLRSAGSNYAALGASAVALSSAVQPAAAVLKKKANLRLRVFNLILQFVQRPLDCPSRDVLAEAQRRRGRVEQHRLGLDVLARFLDEFAGTPDFTFAVEVVVRASPGHHHFAPLWGGLTREHADDLYERLARLFELVLSSMHSPQFAGEELLQRVYLRTLIVPSWEGQERDYELLYRVNVVPRLLALSLDAAIAPTVRNVAMRVASYCLHQTLSLVVESKLPLSLPKDVAEPAASITALFHSHLQLVAGLDDSQPATKAAQLQALGLLLYNGTHPALQAQFTEPKWLGLLLSFPTAACPERARYVLAALAAILPRMQPDSALCPDGVHVVDKLLRIAVRGLVDRRSPPDDDNDDDDDSSTVSIEIANSSTVSVEIATAAIHLLRKLQWTAGWQAHVSAAFSARLERYVAQLDAGSRCDQAANDAVSVLHVLGGSLPRLASGMSVSWTERPPKTGEVSGTVLSAGADSLRVIPAGKELSVASVGLGQVLSVQESPGELSSFAALLPLLSRLAVALHAQPESARTLRDRQAHYALYRAAARAIDDQALQAAICSDARWTAAVVELATSSRGALSLLDVEVQAILFEDELNSRSSDDGGDSTNEAQQHDIVGFTPSSFDVPDGGNDALVDFDPSWWLTEQPGSETFVALAVKAADREPGAGEQHDGGRTLAQLYAELGVAPRRSHVHPSRLGRAELERLASKCCGLLALAYCRKICEKLIEHRPRFIRTFSAEQVLIVYETAAPTNASLARAVERHARKHAAAAMSEALPRRLNSILKHCQFGTAVVGASAHPYRGGDGEAPAAVAVPAPASGASSWEILFDARSALDAGDTLVFSWGYSTSRELSGEQLSKLVVPLNNFSYALHAASGPKSAWGYSFVAIPINPDETHSAVPLVRLLLKLSHAAGVTASFCPAVYTNLVRAVALSKFEKRRDLLGTLALFFKGLRETVLPAEPHALLAFDLDEPLAKITAMGSSRLGDLVSTDQPVALFDQHLAALMVELSAVQKLKADVEEQLKRAAGALSTAAAAGDAPLWWLSVVAEPPPAAPLTPAVCRYQPPVLSSPVRWLNPYVRAEECRHALKSRHPLRNVLVASGDGMHFLTDARPAAPLKNVDLVFRCQSRLIVQELTVRSARPAYRDCCPGSVALFVCTGGQPTQAELQAFDGCSYDELPESKGRLQLATKLRLERDGPYQQRSVFAPRSADWLVVRVLEPMQPSAVQIYIEEISFGGDFDCAAFVAADDVLSLAEPLPLAADWTVGAYVLHTAGGVLLGSERDDGLVAVSAEQELGYLDGSDGRFHGCGFSLQRCAADWHHVFVVCRQGRLQFYVDFQPVGVVASALPAPATLCTVGNTRSGRHPFGAVRGLRVYPGRGLTEAQLTEALARDFGFDVGLCVHPDVLWVRGAHGNPRELSPGVWEPNASVCPCPTVFATGGLTSGRWYYEATVLSESPARVGWVQAGTKISASKLLGGEPGGCAYSGFAGKGGTLYQDGRERACGPAWKVGDVVGCYLDLGGGEISFALNGVALGDSLAALPPCGRAVWYPCWSVAGEAPLDCNLGKRPFRYPPPLGYMGPLPELLPAELRKEQKKSPLTSVLQALVTRVGVLRSFAARTFDLPDEFHMRVQTSLLRAPTPAAAVEQADYAAWTSKQDEDLIVVMNHLVGDSPRSWPPQKLCLSPADQATYLELAAKPAAELVWRAAVLKQLNVTLAALLPYVNLDEADDPTTLAHLVVSLKSLVLLPIKVSFLTACIGRLVSSKGTPEISVRRLARTAKGTLKERHTTFYQIYKAMKKYRASHYRHSGRAWEVRLVGEAAVDDGGPYRESLSELCEELMSGDLPLFVESPNARNRVGVNRGCYVPNSDCVSHHHLAMYRFVGNLMGLALCSDLHLNLRFSQFFWKRLVGEQRTLDDLEAVDVHIVRFIELLRSDVDDDMLPAVMFTAPLSNGAIVELLPNGRDTQVSSPEQRLRYTRLVEERRLHEDDLQMNAIIAGFSGVLPRSLLSLFTWRELELLVCGQNDFDVDLLHDTARYAVSSFQNSAAVRHFWSVLRSFTPDERCKFLRFAWGQSTLPPKNSPKFKPITLQPLTSSSPDKCLPTCATCYFKLNWPDYSSEAVAAERLRFAINNCVSIDTDGGSGAIHASSSEEDDDDLSPLDASLFI